MSSTLVPTTSIKGYILAGDETGYPVIDLLANGYVEEPSWGWNFGTSFATPRVFSEIVNFYDENLSPRIETGEYVPEPIQLDDEPHSEEEVSAFVNGVVDAISTDRGCPCQTHPNRQSSR